MSYMKLIYVCRRTEVSFQLFLILFKEYYIVYGPYMDLIVSHLSDHKSYFLVFITVCILSICFFL